MPLFSSSELTSLNLQLPEKRGSGMFGDPLTPPTAVAVWSEVDGGGPTAAGEIITERTAMSISTVYTCVTTLAEAVSSLPCKLIRNVDGGVQDARENNLYSLLAYEPNPDMTACTFWSTMVGCAALTGNGYAEITRDPDGTPNGFWPLHPLKTEPVRQKDGTLAFRSHDGMKDGSYRVIKAKDVLHFPLFAMDGIKGISPVRAARESFALSKAAEKYGSRYFGNGAKQDSVLIKNGPAPDPKTQTELRESWHQAYGGANAHKQAILFGDWSVHTIGVDPQDAQFLGLRNFQRADIAAMYHLQPHQAGDTSRLSNANHTQAQLTYMTDTLRPILFRIEQELRRKLIAKNPDLQFKFDETERLRGDFASLTAAYAMYLDRAVMSPNEVRREIGLNPYGPEGNVFTYALNKGNAEQLLRDTTLIPAASITTPQADPQNPPPGKKKK